MTSYSFVKRLFGLLIAVILCIIFAYPIITVINIMTYYRSENSKKLLMEESRTVIVDALNRYHIDHDNYPLKLSELIPNYLKSIPAKTITTNTDWQYESNGERYDFGYLEYPEKLDLSWICSYSSDKPEWVCGSGNFGSLGQIPTPLP